MIRPTFQIEEKNPDVFSRLKAELKELDGAFVKVGFPDGVKPGEPTREGGNDKPYSDIGEVARVAIWNEFGATIKVTEKMRKYLHVIGIHLKAGTKAIHIPSRPFFRTAIDTNRPGLHSLMDKTAAAFLGNKIGPQKTLEIIGLWMQDKIKRMITAGDWIPNADSTKKLKESSRPLIDTSQMINSVTFTTHKAGEQCEREGTVVVK